MTGLRPSPARLLAAVIAVLALLPATSALATTETASTDLVTATLTYKKVDDFRYKGLQLTITRAGLPPFTTPVTVKGCEQPFCKPAGADEGDGSLRVVDIDADDQPEVIVDLYSGGAHCCAMSAIFHGGDNTQFDRNWGDPGYTLEASAGQIATFVTADDRFAYAFASYADSALPVRLLQLREGSWRDVTGGDRASVQADADGLAKEYRKRRRGHYALGVLAAWVADEYRLGRKAEANRFLAAELKAGRLRGLKPWPQRSAYVKELKKQLRRWGYA